jgi:hypothetical protein
MWEGMKYRDTYGRWEEKGEALALPPWGENRFRLLSLWDMLRFSADRFQHVMTALSAFSQLIRDSPQVESLPPETVEVLLQESEELFAQLPALGLRLSAVTAEEIKVLLRQDPSVAQLESLLSELMRRVHHELEFVLFLVVPADKYDFYQPPAPLFGQEVWDRFPSAIFDIGEAGKCFALDRYTACVFHLMRALEVCLAALARDLSVAYERGANWNKILNQVDKALKEKLQANSVEKALRWKEREEFYSGAAALLRTVKNAWRNSVSHTQYAYDEERARMVYQAVEGIMRHLATELQEKESTV